MTTAPDQFSMHTKTTSKGAPCDVCGCTSARKGAQHRALVADELYRPENRGAVYVVRRSACFGADHVDTAVAC